MPGLRPRPWWIALGAFLLPVLLEWPRGVGAAAPPPLRFDHDGHTRIPFDLRLQHVWVRGQLNGADSVWIVVDTGASSSVMDDAVARALGLRVVGHHEARGAGGSQPGTTVENLTIALPGLTLHRATIQSTDLSAITQTGGRPMQLVLGYELFRDCTVRFDYDAHVMDVWDAAHAPSDLPGVTLPVTLIGNHPYVDGTLSIAGRAPVKGRFVIDTGSASSLLAQPEMARRESLVAAFPRTLVLVSRGVGGEGWNHVGRADSFSVGGLTFVRPLVVVPDSMTGFISAPGTMGNIGGQLLGRCRITFDYPHRSVRLEPGPGFDRPFEGDKLGAVLIRGADGVVVRWVGDDTPAAEAGLRVGDRVTRIDGEDTTSFDPATLRTRFLEDGKVVRIEVRRGDQSIAMSVKLRRLI